MKPATARDGREGLFSEGGTACRRTAAATAVLACSHAAAAAVTKSMERDDAAAARARAVLQEEPLLRATMGIAVTLCPPVQVQQHYLHGR